MLRVKTHTANNIWERIFLVTIHFFQKKFFFFFSNSVYLYYCGKIIRKLYINFNQSFIIFSFFRLFDLLIGHELLEIHFQVQDYNARCPRFHRYWSETPETENVKLWEDDINIRSRQKQIFGRASLVFT